MQIEKSSPVAKMFVIEYATFRRLWRGWLDLLNKSYCFALRGGAAHQSSKLDENQTRTTSSQEYRRTSKKMRGVPCWLSLVLSTCARMTIQALLARFGFGFLLSALDPSRTNNNYGHETWIITTENWNKPTAKLPVIQYFHINDEAPLLTSSLSTPDELWTLHNKSIVVSPS